jgi:hypothetical protein
VSPLEEILPWVDRIKIHFEIVGRKGLPDPETLEGAKMYGEWARTLIDRRTEPVDLEVASRKMKDRRVTASEHFPTLLSLAGEAQRSRVASENAARNRAQTFSFEAAEEVRIKRDWAALPETEREAARHLVRSRWPEVAPPTVEVFARLWWSDPSAIPPVREPVVRKPRERPAVRSPFRPVRSLIPEIEDFGPSH